MLGAASGEAGAPTLSHDWLSKRQDVLGLLWLSGCTATVLLRGWGSAGLCIYLISTFMRIGSLLMSLQGLLLLMKSPLGNTEVVGTSSVTVTGDGGKLIS